MYAELAALLPEWFKALVLRIYIGKKYRALLAGGVRVNLQTYLGKNVRAEKNTRLANAHVGDATYIGTDCNLSNTAIGKFCSIGSRVRANLGIHPSKTMVSTHPAFFSTSGQAGFTFVKRSLFCEHRYVNPEKGWVVQIGNDVWIGDDVTLLDGVTIGDGAVIGTGSIVTRDVEAYSINAGIPSRKISQRFNEKEIDFLQQYQWWNKEWAWLERNADDFRDIRILIEKNCPEVFP